MIQRNENNGPNTVYLKGIGHSTKRIFTLLKITQQHSKSEEWNPQIKPGNIKFAPSSFSHATTRYISAELDSYLQLFKKIIPDSHTCKIRAICQRN